MFGYTEMGWRILGYAEMMLGRTRENYQKSPASCSKKAYILSKKISLREKMTKIYVLGTFHLAKVNLKLKDKIQQEKIQAIVKEVVGLKDAFTLKNFLLEPLFVTFLKLWTITNISGRDSQSLYQISKDCQIKFHFEVDATASEDIRIMHSPLNYIYAAIILGICVLWTVNYPIQSFPSWLSMPIGLIAGIILYSAAMVAFKLQKFRNNEMTQKTFALIEQHHYNSVIFSCGNRHKNEIIKIFKERGFEVEDLGWYQHPWLKIIANVLQ